MIGRNVEIRSAAGMVYRGIIKTIREAGELGELFELRSPKDAEYQRLVYVTERLAQIRTIEEEG